MEPSASHHCVVKISRRCHRIAVEILPRACLKNHSRHLHPPLSVIFAPNSVNVARYASLIWHKSPTKWGIHLPKSIFQTRSSTTANDISVNHSGIMPTQKSCGKGLHPFERFGKQKPLIVQACQNRSQSEDRGCGIRLVTGFSGS